MDLADHGVARQALHVKAQRALHQAVDHQHVLPGRYVRYAIVVARKVQSIGCDDAALVLQG
jgi:hypothetical protein